MWQNPTILAGVALVLASSAAQAGLDKAWDRTEVLAAAPALTIAAPGQSAGVVIAPVKTETPASWGDLIMFARLTIAAAALLAAAGTAEAGLYRADFEEILDIPALPSAGPRVLAVPNRGVASNAWTFPELTNFEEIENPSHFNGYLSVDAEPTHDPVVPSPIPDTITLRHEETNTGYQIARITIFNIVFEEPDQYIAGVTLNSGAIIDTLNSDPFDATVSFGEESITFLWQVRDLSLGQIFHFIPDGSIQYQVHFGTRTFDVPEPAALPLAGVALAALLLVRRRNGPPFLS